MPKCSWHWLVPTRDEKRRHSNREDSGQVRPGLVTNRNQSQLKPVWPAHPREPDKSTTALSVSQSLAVLTLGLILVIHVTPFAHRANCSRLSTGFGDTSCGEVLLPCVFLEGFPAFIAVRCNFFLSSWFLTLSWTFAPWNQSHGHYI